MPERDEAAALRLRALVLGAAAGGGFPQWNCNCPNCAGFRRGEPGLRARTQASLAVTADGESVAVLNAAPEIIAQIAANPLLHPGEPERVGGRHSPIRTVMITNADIDAIAGLLSLREAEPFRLVATGETLSVIDSNPIFKGLDRSLVRFETAALETPVELVAGVMARLYSVPGKVPLYLEGESVATDLEGEQTVGVEMTGPRGERIHWIPGCAKMTAELAAPLRGADAVFFDGTVYTDDEMIRLGVGTKTGRRMGHMAMSGPDGSLAAFADIAVKRRIYVHINNTNPVLREGSPERRAVEAAGWIVAHDGLEVLL
jgi:pyrroloquinoline quinone biosynthesis protein B